MKNFSVKAKIVLWFSVTLFFIVFLMSLLTFNIGRKVLNEGIIERLTSTVNTNANEVEYHGNLSESEQEPEDQFLLYKDGYLEIDDDFCDFFEGISTALYDESGTLLYGEAPISIPKNLCFTFTSVDTIKYKGETFYVFERRIGTADLDGLWLRGVVSQNESINILYNVLHLSFWALPLLVLITIIGGYLIARGGLKPIEKIVSSAESIAGGDDLSKRIDIGPGNDEVHRLASTFNNMLQRLEKAFESEKQFTSDASHELRTPTAVILAQSEYALELCQTEDEYREALEVIKRQALNMSDLISKLLFFSRLEQGTEPFQPVACNISQLVETVCNEQVLLREKNITISTDIEQDIISVVDRSLMGRLLNNLINNAYKYGKENGHTAVTLKLAEGNVILSVSDDGIGISRENLEKIWTRFYQVDTSRSDETSGLGLGLSMVMQIASLHGGSIDVESEPDKGTLFTFIFPQKL